jgi:hypothetical protein
MGSRGAKELFSSAPLLPRSPIVPFFIHPICILIYGVKRPLPVRLINI